MNAKKGYMIEHRKPVPAWKTGIVNKMRLRGPHDGFTRTEAIQSIAKFLRENHEVGKILFDNNEVVPDHKEKLVQIAKLWDQVRIAEETIKPYGATRAKIGKT